MPFADNLVAKHSNNVKDEKIANSESTYDERNEKIENEQMESNIHSTITSMDLQPSSTQTNIKMHPAMKDENRSYCYGKNEMNYQINADQYEQVS